MRCSIWQRGHLTLLVVTCSALPTAPWPPKLDRTVTSTMRMLLSMLWLALACSSVHTTLSKSDAKKAASKTLLEKVGVVWGLASSCPLGLSAEACNTL